jgi:RNA polymerase sigma-70 factor (ECF subfamily)
VSTLVLENYTAPVAIAQRSSDDELLTRLRAGDEAAFQQLVTRNHRAMARLARSFVQSPSIADEVVQETWLAVIRGLDRFEGRSSLRTWIFRILVNRAKTRGIREQRTTPFSALTTIDEDTGPTVDPDRFFVAGAEFAGYWSIPPNRFFELPEDQLLAAEARALIERAISDLPDRQQQVIRMRDLEGWEAEEVCELLEISAENQRVLLHRARAKVRSAVESHFSELMQT